MFVCVVGYFSCIVSIIVVEMEVIYVLLLFIGNMHCIGVYFHRVCILQFKNWVNCDSQFLFIITNFGSVTFYSI